VLADDAVAAASAEDQLLAPDMGAPDRDDAEVDPRLLVRSHPLRRAGVVPGLALGEQRADVANELVLGGIARRRPAAGVGLVALDAGLVRAARHVYVSTRVTS